MDRLLSPLTAQAIAVSESVRRFCVTERAIAPDRIRVIPNGIEPSRPVGPEEAHRWRAQLGLPEGVPVVGSITRFYPVKGVRYLISAMPRVLERVPSATLVLWGEGPDRGALAAQAEALGVAERVRFAGYDPEAARRLALLDCFVLPSLSEGNPFVLLEAMAAGCPIVASRTGGIPELVREPDEALLVQPEDTTALAAALTSILTDAALARRMRQASREASRRYSLERHVATLQTLYAGLTERR